VGPEGLELIVNLLNSLSNTQHAQIVTVKATVSSAGFGWTGLDIYRLHWSGDNRFRWFCFTNSCLMNSDSPLTSTIWQVSGCADTFCIL